MLSAVIATCQTVETLHALTRDEVISVCEEYATLHFIVDFANVYPGNQSGCYTTSCNNIAPLGPNYGMAYSYGNWNTIDEFQGCLADGGGAGNVDCMDYSCYHNSMCGIDCSGLVGRAWRMTGDKPGTTTLPNCSDDYPSTFVRADILNKPDSHVMIFHEWDEGEYGQWAWVYHSTIMASERGVARNLVYYPGLIDDGYIPRRSDKLKDGPIASLIWIGSDSSGTVAWETGWEKETEGFVLYRILPDGSRETISDLIPAKGSAGGGARYSFRDPTYPGPGAVYRLQEVETTGNTIWLGKTSAADGIPDEQSRAVSRDREVNRNRIGSSIGAAKEHKLCALTEYPENQNLEWLAICPSEWVNALTPLVNYRQSQGMTAGVWTFTEITGCCMGFTKECIQELLRSAVEDWTIPPKYLLLVGDAYYLGGEADLIPMWSRYESELGWYDEDSTWSDRPYADPDEDGEIEIFVGRIPAMSDTDVTNAVTKIIERENSADPSYGKRSLLFVEDSGDCGNDSAWILELADSVNVTIPTDWSRTVIVQSEIGGTYAHWEAVADSAWDAGQGIVLFFGNCSGWWDFNNFMNVGGGWNAGMLSANHMYPFVFGGSCGEGGLDRENLYGGRAAMEQLLCSYPDRGSVGGFLPSRSLHPYTAVQIANAFIDRVFRGEPTLGSAAYRGMDDLLQMDSGAEDHVWEYVFFGDPAMRSFVSDATGVVQHEIRSGLAFALEHPLPHPISASSTIRFSLPTAADADLRVYDLAGRRVKTILSGRMQAGRHAVEWDGMNDRGRKVASGVYFFRLRAGQRETTRKVIVLR